MEYKPENIRNVMVVGHQGSGKTSLIESMAYINGFFRKEKKPFFS